MRRKILISLIVITISSGLAWADCPSADLTGDCFVGFEDFALMAAQWPDGYDYNDLAVMISEWLVEGAPDPCGMVWVYIDDPGVPDHEGFTGYMSKYETTNAQYCEYLNAAFASGDIYVSSNIVYGSSGSNSGEDFVDEIYFDTYAADSNSQIIFSGCVFSIRTRDGYDMSNHPVSEVTWYGAMAFCNYYGYRLPTEWEWQAVADHEGELNYGCGPGINHNRANYDFDNPLNLSSTPYTTPVDYYETGGRPGPYGYGMCDMAGNVWEWTSSLWNPGHSYLIIRGGCWYAYDSACVVSERYVRYPHHPYNEAIGFRIVLDDLELRLPGQASNPNPPDGNSVGNLDADLSWTAGSYATSHDVYFGTSNPPPFIGNQTDTIFDPCTMEPNNTYYWCIDEVNKWGKTTGQIWSFTTWTLPGQASNPNPPNGSSISNLDYDLSWTAGSYTTSHDVYFGTSNPPPFIHNQNDTTYDPGTMTSFTTYYWRIDEINQWGKTTGVEWSFSTVTPPPPPP
jgi:hypothetical protein